jgi:phenylalanyl-tRNA synthetase beta chain
MKFSLSWLKTYLDTEANVDVIAQAMTMAGLEVEHIIDPAKALAPFSVAKVISAAKHPNADKLQVLQVQTLDGLKEIVCGAPNARAGMTSIYAPIGAYVPGLGVTLIEKPVRGVVSYGMMCSGSELEIDAEADGILDLGADWSVGTPAAQVFGSEPVIDFEVTPNRPDWLGVHGIARDLAATGIGAFIDPAIEPVPTGFACPVKVKVDGDMCLQFTGRVIKGVNNGPSPKWLQDRLKSIGLKPISALVDITNFMAYDRARPLHVYDLAKLSGRTLVAGPAADGERLLALDGKTYDVAAHMCAIMDGSGVIGLGGIMGGESTKVDATTIDVFLESAYFDPIVTAQTGRDTKIASDAQYRFARGVDPEFLIPGLEMATRLILDICGGEASEIVTDGQALNRPDHIEFDPAFVKHLTGLVLQRPEIELILSALGFGLTNHGESYRVEIPSWRRDVNTASGASAADLVEEIARIRGFNEIPAAPLPAHAPKSGGVLTPLQAKARLARRALAALGYQETVTWSFLRQDWALAFGGGDAALKLANPIASELDCMRPSILPNLLDAARRNAARGLYGVRLFEIGPVYAGLEPQDQTTVICGLVAPDKARHWQSDGQDAIFAMKSDLMDLLATLGVSIASLQLIQGQNAAYWHPGRSARLQLGPKQILAQWGELHPQILKAMNIETQHLGFEIRLDHLPIAKGRAGKSRGALHLSNLMPLSRDFAFLLPENLSADDVIKAIKAADKSLISTVNIFDIYKGQGVPEGLISMAFEVNISPSEATLTEADIEALSTKILMAVEKTGARLRS